LYLYIHYVFCLIAGAISLLVPRFPGQLEPEVWVNSLEKSYQMRPAKLMPTANRYRFNWNRAVLNRASIPLVSLRAKAVVKQTPNIYLPVILGQDHQYTFVLYSSEPIALKTFEIRQGSKVIYRFPQREVKGELKATWNGQAPAGQYQLIVQPADRDASRLLNLTFQHDPQWLR
jgi:hypothetical protein